MCIVKLFGNRNQGPLNVTESKQTHFKYNIQCYSTSNFPIKLFYLIRKTYIRTVIPWFTRLLWQPKNRVNQKSRYTSHSIEEKIVKKISITLTFYTIKCPYTNLFRQGQKTA